LRKKLVFEWVKGFVALLHVCKALDSNTINILPREMFQCAEWSAVGLQNWARVWVTGA